MTAGMLQAVMVMAMMMMIRILGDNANNEADADHTLCRRTDRQAGRHARRTTVAWSDELTSAGDDDRPDADYASGVATSANHDPCDHDDEGDDDDYDHYAAALMVVVVMIMVIPVMTLIMLISVLPFLVCEDCEQR